MQQPPYNPSGGPSGPYPNAPYSAPPPRQGPNMMMYCLGCLGLAALFVVLGIGFIYVQARKMIGPPVTTATLSTVLPPGVPVYPRFTLVEKGSRNMRVPVPSRAGAAPRMTFLTFSCPDPMSVVGPWYGRTLKPRGWVGGPSPTDPNQYQFKKGDMLVSLQASGASRSGPKTGSSGGAIVMSVMQGIPAGAPPPSPSALPAPVPARPAPGTAGR